MANISKIQVSSNIYDIKDAALTSRVDAIESAIFPPSPQELICVSDSYGLGRNSTEDWITAITPYLTDFSRIYNWSNGSMGIVKQGDGGFRAKDYMIDRASQVADPDAVSVVIIAMGANDINDHANFDYYFADLHTYINTTYKNAKIYVGMIGNNLVLSGSGADSYKEVVALYQSAGDKYTDVKYLHGVEYIMHNARLVQSDKVHPTTDGSRAIAKGIACAFRTGSYRYRYKGTCTGSKFTIVFVMDGETTWIYFAPANSNGQQFTTISYIDWETVQDPVLYAGHSTNIYGFLSAFDSNVDQIGLSLRYSAGVVAVAPTTAGVNTLATGVKIFGFATAVATIEF